MEQDKKTVEEKNREMAIAYAKYLMEHNLKPGEESEADFVEPESSKEEETKKEEAKTNKTSEKQISERMTAIEDAAADPIFLIDRMLDKIDEKATEVTPKIKKTLGNIAAKYDSSRKIIGIAVLVMCVLCAAVMIVFDKFTLYEYAYNGKVLGFVDSQDDVTNVLSIASDQLNKVKEDKEAEDIEFKANDNVSFKLVRASGQDVDDADTMVNKLAYMTDIEVTAYAIYDGANLVTVVKSQEDAEGLLVAVKNILGTPDEGMKLLSVDFEKPLEIKPVNIMLTSVQSNAAATEQMTKGGSTKYYHLVEEGETVSSIAKEFNVNVEDVYDEDDSKVAEKAWSGDKVCIHKTTVPVSVRIVEKGKMKEIVPYETIEQESGDYYIGDTVVGVEGVDGVQLFEGTLTKVGGKVTDRKTIKLEVLTEKVDKIIYIGTSPKPKSTPTGTFRCPLGRGSYIITSGVGARWGTTHEGVDMASFIGNSVYAADGGTVIRAGWYGSYGNCIDIQHANGWITRYGHLSSIGVSAGEGVYPGQLIGAVGSTGFSTGPHLHFETRQNGVIYDPESLVSGGL